MKKIILFLATLIISILIVSCDSDPCDEGYTQLDNGVCVPDYVAGVANQDFTLGYVFYHSEFGVINFKNGKWFNANDLIIKNLND